MLARRRFIAISAAATATAVALLPSRSGTALEPLLWRGDALGADAQLTLYPTDPASGRRLLAECLAEVERLERIFSLYRSDSALVQLNAQGRLDGPPLELVELLGESRALSVLSDGAFDVTVQPLWDLYAAHFTKTGADPSGPPEAEVARVRQLVDWRGVAVEPGRISLARPGMAVTLNGIAQGYVTDKVAALLRRRGMDHVLVDMGEIRALGARPEGLPWRVGLEEGGEIGLVDRAIATTSPDGTAFSPSCNHLFDPATGHSPPFAGAVSVLATTATLADGLSTALAVGGPRLAGRLAAVPGVVGLLGHQRLRTA